MRQTAEPDGKGPAGAASGRRPEPEAGGLSLRANSQWTLLGNLVYWGCQWGTLVALARLEPPGEAGSFTGPFALGMAVSAPVMMGANLQLRAVQATDARREYEFGHYLGLRLVTAPLALLVIAAAAFLAGWGRATALVVLAVGAAKAIEAAGDVFYGLFQRRERLDRMAKSMMVKGPLSLAALALTVYLTGEVVWGVVALGGAWLAVFVAYDVPSGAALLAEGGGEGLRPRWEPGRLAKLAWLALPLGFVMMLVSLNANIPKYFVERHLGLGPLGIFALMAFLAMAGQVVVGALGQSASPRLARLYAEADTRAYSRLVLGLAAAGAALGAGAVLVALAAGGPLLTLMCGPEYAADSGAFVVLMAAGAVLYVSSFLGYAMTAARYFRIQALLLALVCGVSVAACHLAIPAMGILGAAVAMLIAAGVYLAGSAAVVAHSCRRMASARVP